MHIKDFIRLIGFSALLLPLFSCQKDDASDNSIQADICPEIVMNNYEEAGMIINDYLIAHSGNSESENIAQLDNYLENCDCVQSISKKTNSDNSNSKVLEYELSFVLNSDTIKKSFDIVVYNDKQLVFRKFIN